MGKITLAQAAEWCGGKMDPRYGETVFFGANNDTRKLQPGQLFVALQGQRDGHTFIPAALEKGAAAVLCTHCDGDYPAIVVEDTLLALGQIAREERRRIGMRVVGVTGSVGKSTTKEMIAAVLDGTYQVSRSPENHNNAIGMPMAILSMPEDTQVGVLEMGMNHFGEIRYLSQIACPDVAVIVNIGVMHMENLGSREGILRAKLEILEGLEPGGRVLLNGDDDLLWQQRDADLKPRFFGWQNQACQYLGTAVERTDAGLSFRVRMGQDTLPICMELEGEHYVSDALAAVSVGLELGVSPADIQNRLGRFRNMAGRQEIYRAGEYTVIEDCYNAGPESMEAALEVLGGKHGRRIAVLGDMLELGVCSAAEHYRVGRIAAEHAQLVLAYGEKAGQVISGAVTGGMDPATAKAFTDRQKLVLTLKAMARPGDVILFKGSRGMRMERILEAFLAENSEK